MNAEDGRPVLVPSCSALGLQTMLRGPALHDRYRRNLVVPAQSEYVEPPVLSGSCKAGAEVD